MPTQFIANSNTLGYGAGDIFEVDEVTPILEAYETGGHITRLTDAAEAEDDSTDDDDDDDDHGMVSVHQED